ncbi:MAG: hypothetical protein ACRC92_27230 [Peptostreptococcaceae bacterium]
MEMFEGKITLDASDLTELEINSLLSHKEDLNKYIAEVRKEKDRKSKGNKVQGIVMPKLRHDYYK